MDLLPREVLYDIVVRLPIKSLARLRCTCRQLYAEPFMKSRTKRLIEEPKILLASFPERCGPGTKTKPKPKPRFEVAVEFFKASVPQLACPLGPDLLGSCNGLMCFRSNPGVFVIVNPLFEEVLMLSTLPDDIVDLCPPRKKPRSRLQLPRPKDWDNYWCASGLGLDYITGEYKIVMISQSPLRAKVFVLGTTSWRDISTNYLESTLPSGPVSPSTVRCSGVGALTTAAGWSAFSWQKRSSPTYPVPVVKTGSWSTSGSALGSSDSRWRGTSTCGRSTSMARPGTRSGTLMST
ncbi:uncharacterized protein LOC116211361 [Punica granatum]|uniref:Uncharacterized protein LOC116211361 n=1 Tax=Punica granatum TaxID=22663 RepID=A0A6P8E4Y6_PUNGR|nr:uncharacterized protein LOC116211361 [Punica granatum]